MVLEAGGHGLTLQVLQLLAGIECMAVTEFPKQSVGSCMKCCRSSIGPPEMVRGGRQLVRVSPVPSRSARARPASCRALRRAKVVVPDPAHEHGDEGADDDVGQGQRVVAVGDLAPGHPLLDEAEERAVRLTVRAVPAPVPHERRSISPTRVRYSGPAASRYAARSSNRAPTSRGARPAVGLALDQHLVEAARAAARPGPGPCRPASGSG